MLQNTVNVFSVSLIVVTALLLFGCEVSDTGSGSDYNRLCGLYEEIAPRGGQSNIMQTVRLAEKIKQEVPEVYAHYEYLSMLPPDEVYEQIQDLAEAETGERWECPAIRLFYEGD